MPNIASQFEDAMLNNVAASHEISDEEFSMASSLLVEIAALRRQLAQKDILLDQQAKQIDIMSSKQKEFELHSTKLDAAVSHRDQVIAELAASRKLVFEGKIHTTTTH
jgi:hypothetical protein